MSAIEEREVSLTPAADLLPRITSRDVADFPLPNGREEVWRFTPLTRFARVLALPGHAQPRRRLGRPHRHGHQAAIGQSRCRPGQGQEADAEPRLLRGQLGL